MEGEAGSEMRPRACALLAPAVGWCASAFAQVRPTAAEYAQYTGLFAAAARNHTGKIRKLLAAGEYAGMRDAHGRTPLPILESANAR